MQSQQDAAAPSKPASAHQQLRQRRELEELRQFGLAPLAKDVISGKEINPYVPEGVSQAPWFYNVEGPTLEHQRMQGEGIAAESTRFSAPPTMVQVVEQRQQGFRPGSCTNCGAMGHKAPHCLKPKRKMGSVITQKVEDVDRVVVSVDAATGPSAVVDGERQSHQDIWDLHEKRMRESEALVPEAASEDSSTLKKPRTREEELMRAFASQASSTRSTEIKPVPKYLENLDSVAFYDPRTRSMRADPHAEKGSIDSTFRGENFGLYKGDGRVALEMHYQFMTGKSDGLDLSAAEKLIEKLEQEKKLKKMLEENQDRVDEERLQFLLHEAEKHAQ